jgi:hypothetical protein
MTLNQLRKLNPEAARMWEVNVGHTPLTDEQHFRTFRAYVVNGRLYAVWNNGCFYEPFYWRHGRWVSATEKNPRGYGRVAQYYKQACKTLGDLDLARGHYGY